MNVNNTLIDSEGTVVEVLPSSTFRVKINNTEHVMICYISGKIRKHNIRITLGDRVRIETSPYDLDRGRIVFRL